MRQQDEIEAYASAAGMSAAHGRRRAVLALEQAHEELPVVVMHRGKERDRHVWTGEEHDRCSRACSTPTRGRWRRSSPTTARRPRRSR